MNFWRPGVRHTNAPEGSYWLFLQSPDAITGCARVEISTALPLWLAWETFANANGADTREEFYEVIARRRPHRETTPQTEIGCVGLTDPVFFDEPIDFRPFKRDWRYRNPVKTFDASSSDGAQLWEQVRSKLFAAPLGSQSLTTVRGGEIWRPVAVRLGQGGFRNKIIEIYDRRCAVSGERSLPALEAAHIKPYQYVKQHRLTNGLLLRADIHKLFDAGYVSVSDDRRFRVSGALKNDYENGRIYYALDGTELRDPTRSSDRPDPEYLDWHYSTVFRR